MFYIRTYLCLLLTPAVAAAQTTVAVSSGPITIVAPIGAADVAIPASKNPLSPESDGTKPKAKPFEFTLGNEGGRPSAGVQGRLAEGKPLEMLVWSSAGAVAGALVGPAGALVGAGVGALVGLAIAVFAVPHNGPSRAELDARRR